MNNNWYKKEKPLLGLTGLGGGVDGLWVVGAATKTYIDEVFSTYVYTGDGTNSHQIVNGIDLSSKGGFIWGKERGNSGSHYQFDTVRGLNKRLKSNSDSVEETDTFYSSVNSDGYTIEKTTSVNISGNEYVSWTFAKQKGFFDIQTWTGNSTADRQISHNLNCIPGCILIKQTSGAAEDWAVYHRGIGSTAALKLNRTNDADTGIEYFQDTDPTATNFTLGIQPPVNGNGNEYVAYIFAGGESDAATARSVEFDGTDDYLSIPDHADYELGSNDFTLECWVNSYQTSNDYRNVFGKWQGSGQFSYMIRSSNDVPADGWVFFYSTTGSPGGHTIVESGVNIHDGQWHHIAVTRTGGKVRLFTDGNLSKEENITATIYNSTAPVVIASDQGDQWFGGKISNVRIVNGTAVYTSAFRPPTEPLTDITNTKLLCCNNSSVTGSTVCTGTITAGSSPTASADSPFDDPNAFKFGADSDQNLIKCGSYVGSGSAGLEVNLGWEPSFVMYKRTDTTGDWIMSDSVRGAPTAGIDSVMIKANASDSEAEQSYISLTSTGFTLPNTFAFANASGGNYVYIAFRRPDGYVAKPAEAGTDVFAMDTGNGSATIPVFDSGFPVDMAFERRPATTESWYTPTRLTGTKYLLLNDTGAQATSSNMVWDSNVGWSNDQAPSDYQSWMWKRGQGFDVVTYSGQSGAKIVPHSLNAVPEMMWVKNRTYDDANGWTVYHTGLNGGTNPEQYRMRLQSDVAEDDNNLAWNDTAPTATHFTLGTDRMVNQGSYDYIAMLFSSVSGISKVGSYTGQTGNANLTIDLGFTPRLFICKRIDDTAGWYIWDSLRGLSSSGTEKPFYLNSSQAQGNAYNYLDTTASGITLYGGITSEFLGHLTSMEYIYYAHA